MDLKELLASNKWLSGEKYADRRLIYLLGLFGAALIIVAVGIGAADWRMSGRVAAVADDSAAAVSRLGERVQSLRAILNSAETQKLAARALEEPQASAELLASLQGRIAEVSDARVFALPVDGLEPENLGPNGFALYDMLLTAAGGKQALLQLHQVLDPPAMLDMVRVQVGGETVGLLAVELAPGYLLEGFNPDMGNLGYLLLSQRNGRQRSSKLAEFGDPSLLGQVPERRVVPGTLFRMEFPRQIHVSYASTGTLLVVFVVGLLCLAAAALLQHSNRKWERERQIHKATRKRTGRREGKSALQKLRVAAAAPPDDAEFVAEAPDDAGQEVEDQSPPPDTSEPPSLHLRYNIPERRKRRETEHPPVQLVPEIFRAYDIRGIIDKTLDSGVARSVGQAIGSAALERSAGPVVVARDGRLSGPYLMEGMIEGILSTGCDVLDIGAVPTGVLYFAAHEFAAGSGVVITGSHNPPDYNGFKVMVGGDTLYGDAITALYERIREGRFAAGEGQLSRRNVVPDYIEKIAGDIQVERPLKVVIDCGNGIGGVCAADTLRAIGVEALPLFDEVDGTFPNHHPDPSDPENLKDLIESVRLMDADLGLAFDGDADRLGVVTLAGHIIYPDRVMMLLAMDVLDRVPGATIIYDVKCTAHLPKVILEAGGKPMMYKTGHSLIKARMKEVGAPFAGEMSGHFFFKERWYGVDDGIYAAARLLEILGGTDAPPEAILNALPTSFSTPELKVQMQEGENHRFIAEFTESARFDGAQISTIDGLRADYPDGWGLVRASNTTPILVVRFDAETEEALIRIKATFRSQMLALKPDLELPF